MFAGRTPISISIRHAPVSFETRGTQIPMAPSNSRTPVT